MRITVDQAREYFADPSQRIHGISPETLPDEGFQYYAKGDVCMVFHAGPLPGTFMPHIAMKPSGKGRSDGDVRDLLDEFDNDNHPKHLFAMIEENRRYVISLAKRVGFRMVGSIGGEIATMEWRPQ